MNFRDFLDFNKICDAHIHLPNLSERGVEFIKSENYFCISCSHSKEEFLLQDEFYQGGLSNQGGCGATPRPAVLHILSSFGAHPQNPTRENLLYLESLLEKNKIDCIGECGFDFFTPEFKSNAVFQEEAFIMQIELAAKYNRPVIIHSRKSIDRIFYHSKALSKPPVVLFHSFSGTYKDALSLLNHGINAVFSFSQQIIKGATKAIECVKLLPIERILLETDAPYQTLKGESATNPELIYQVYKTAFAFRSGLDFTAFCECLYSNYLQFAQGRL